MRPHSLYKLQRTVQGEVQNYLVPKGTEIFKFPRTKQPQELMLRWCLLESFHKNFKTAFIKMFHQVKLIHTKV